MNRTQNSVQRKKLTQYGADTLAVVKSKHCDKEEMSLKTCTSATFLYLGLKAEFYPENVYLCSAL